ncbi:MAG TPA: RsmD family RNA methyltransferase [Prolixibacteraceae bacterium]|nr:RsmD family RNA methyltransferase [Prolixibacteraceae bacterium]HPS13128.1 RsmD family RNA methyltransferase [Prolixibacteraceae bacterium]
MRIISGKYKGRNFEPGGKSFKARPTTDFAKESLFNILANHIDFEEVKFLELFAGTGSISYEFISRGCSDVTMVELNFKHIEFIKSVLKEIDEAAKVYRADVFKFLKGHRIKYDVIFADPPYDLPRFGEIPGLVLQENLLKENGILIVEHSKQYDFSTIPGFYEMRNYGSVHFSFFRNANG